MAFSNYKPETHERYVNWLGHFVDFFTSTKLHPSQKDDALKPTQKGVLLTTHSILMLQKELLNVGFDFVLSSRFSNDCIGKNYTQVVQFYGIMFEE